MEFLVAGATAVQLGTVNFYRPQLPMQILDALPAALAELGRQQCGDDGAGRCGLGSSRREQ